MPHGKRTRVKLGLVFGEWCPACGTFLCQLVDWRDMRFYWYCVRCHWDSSLETNPSISKGLKKRREDENR